MSKYIPTNYIDYVTPINATNLNKSEKATSQQGDDILTLSESVLFVNDDIQLITQEIFRLDEVTNINTSDITTLGETVLLVHELLDNKADKVHHHDEYVLKSEVSNVILARQICRYIDFL